MNEIDASLKPDPPFIWPEPRVVAGVCAYRDGEPPFNHLALSSDSVFGIVSAARGDAADVIDGWLNDNAALTARIVVAVYPTCLTHREDLSRLVDMTERHSGRIVIRIRAYDSVLVRPTNALCFQDPHSGVTQLVTGPTENLGLAASGDGQVNFVMRADPMILEAFSQYFTLVWASATDVSASGVAQIPHLVLPPGDREGGRLWREYVAAFDRDALFANHPLAGDVRVDAQTGNVQIVSGGKEIPNPTEELGIPKLDLLAEKIARLYQKGVLVSVDKLTRIPPLDAPLDPNVFGDPSEIHQGNVVRRVNMRVSIIGEQALAGIERCRKALRPLLNTLTFGLADNMRWMPHSARELLELELNRINSEGQKQIADLLKGDVKAFITGKRDGLVADINAMFLELGRAERATDAVIDTIMESLEKRLTKAQGANFMPRLTYSTIEFARGRDSSWASPWEQAYAFLNDIAKLPRRVFADPFFARGLRIDEDVLLPAMNVADDALLRGDSRRGIKDRSRIDLEVLKTIEKSCIGAREKCELVDVMLNGGRLDAILAQLRGHGDSEGQSERKHLIEQLGNLDSTPD